MEALLVFAALLTVALATSFEALEEAEAISISAVRQTLKCNTNCKLDLCSQLPQQLIPRGPEPRILLRAPGLRFGPLFCKKDKSILNIKLGQALIRPVKSSAAYVPISQYRPAGLDTPFKKKLFKIFQRTSVTEGFTRRKALGNQEAFLDNVCIILPIKKYQVVGRRGRLGKVVKSKKPSSCVSFKTRGSSLYFELSWDSFDDLDLEVTEPGGFKIDRFNPEAPSGGKLLFDTASETDVCFPDTEPGDDKRETVLYTRKRPAAPGKYRVEIEHFKNCGTGPTNFILRVVVNGVVVRTRKGTTDKAGAELVASYIFTISQ